MLGARNLLTTFLSLSFLFLSSSSSFVKNKNGRSRLKIRTVGMATIFNSKIPETWFPGKMTRKIIRVYDRLIRFNSSTNLFELKVNNKWSANIVANARLFHESSASCQLLSTYDNIALATKWLWISSIPPNDRIRNHLVANPIILFSRIIFWPFSLLHNFTMCDEDQNFVGWKYFFFFENTFAKMRSLVAYGTPSRAKSVERILFIFKLINLPWRESA